MSVLVVLAGRFRFSAHRHDGTLEELFWELALLLFWSAFGALGAWRSRPHRRDLGFVMGFGLGMVYSFLLIFVWKEVR